VKKRFVKITSCQSLYLQLGIKNGLSVRFLSVFRLFWAGKENAGPSTENERGSAKGKGEVRGGAPRNQSIQSKIYGRYDASIREVPGDGGAAATVFQRRSLWHSQMSQYITRSSVSSLPISHNSCASMMCFSRIAIEN
jgi:hypothetical protein